MQHSLWFKSFPFPLSWGNRCKYCAVFYFPQFSFPGDLSAPESSELEQERKRQQLQDPVLMPLPDAGADGPLDWAHLVDAAKAFEGKYILFSFPL